ncbi:hypothetical protein HYU89_01395 [Candidatus Collierbacteria bacterium]|nr:hypothetical protein [Candidatus Collierbacteria bacterium]
MKKFTILPIFMLLLLSISLQPTPADALETCVPQQINPNEPHEFRPNPGQICTPEIPQAARLTCGTDLVAQKTVNAARGGTGCSPANPTVGQTVTCTRDLSVDVPISIGLAGLELPIAGVASNTQVSDTLNPAQKMSQYTSWYLQGVKEDGTNAKALADYMNGIINSTGGIGNLKLLSPVFNIPSFQTPGLFAAIEAAGAKFSELDAFAGNTYTLEGRKAYDWYADFLKGKADQYGKKVIFTEFGDFATINTQPDNRPDVVATMKQEFDRTMSDGNIESALYFNALGDNPGFGGFRLSPDELRAITQGAPRRAGINSASPVNGGGGFATRVADLGLGWTLEIAYNPSDKDAVVSAFNTAIARGLTPILRICAGDACEFSDPAVYAQFLRDIAPRINGTFWAIAGPNEPDIETWVSGTSSVQTDQFSFLGPIKKLVSDTVIDQKKTDLINAAVAGTAYNQIIGYVYHNAVIPRLEAKNLLQQNPRQTDIQRIRLTDMANHLNPAYIEGDQEALKWYILWRDMPFSQTVDLPGEIFATTSLADANVKNARLTITSTLADFRVAFPHLVEDDQMSQLLQAVFRPLGVAETSGFSEPNAVDYSTVNRATPFNTNYCDLRETYSNRGDSLETTRTITGNFSFTKTVTYSYTHGEKDANGKLLTTIDVDVSGPVSVFARNPLSIDNIYDRLVGGPSAIFKAIFPNPDQTLGGIKDLPAAAPISMNCGSGCTVKPGNQEGRKAEVFFAHWGSVLTYFHDKLQKALDPLGRTSAGPNPPGGGGLSCTMPITSCGPVNWNLGLFDTYFNAYNSDNNSSWSLIKEPWAQQLIGQTAGWSCPQFVSTLWLEESGGSAIGQYDLGCIYHLDGHRALTSDHRGGPADFPTYTAFKNHYEPILKDQLACLRSYIEPIGEDFQTFMCQYSGETDADPTKPFRQCDTFTNNPNFPVNMCKIGGEVGIATPN